jgi:hypothetical protein
MPARLEALLHIPIELVQGLALPRPARQRLHELSSLRVPILMMSLARWRL